MSAALRAAMAATETARREEEARKEAIQEKDFAASRAAILEEEVKQSKSRVCELESLVERIKEQKHKKELSLEQEKELQDAKSLIQTLQEKLKRQEMLAKTGSMLTADDDGGDSADDVAAKLRRKLQKMERQILQAGLNIVEDIPYAEAKEKIQSISKRMQDIGNSEVVLEDKEEQAKLRREYFRLEQEMERYNTALVMTDEYIAETKRKETEWNDTNLIANREALKVVRSCIPVNIANLSEQDLVALTTPSGKSITTPLARRLKRTSILQLLRVNPDSILRMHPSVIDGYRPTGLSLLERRALHAVLYDIFLQWQVQKQEELAGKKFAWYNKLYNLLKENVASYNSHIHKFPIKDDIHECNLLGKQCPVKAMAGNRKLYEPELGFPKGNEYMENEVIKSDPDGAGEKALAEAQSHANVMLANHRLKKLKTHYGMNVRQVSKAAGFLDDIDALVESLNHTEEDWIEKTKQEIWPDEISAYSATLQDMKQFLYRIAERSSMHMSGKRNKEKDGTDTRSALELTITLDATTLICFILSQIIFRVESINQARQHRSIMSTISSIQDFISELDSKAQSTHQALTNSSYSSTLKLLPWNDRKSKTPRQSSPGRPSEGRRSSTTPCALKSQLLKSINKPEKTSPDGKKAPLDMLAAIRSRNKQVTASCPDLNQPNLQNRPAAVNPLLEAIRKRAANTA